MRRLVTLLSALAFVGACAATASLLTVPGYEGVATAAGTNGGGFARETGLLLLVTLLSGLPLLVALRRPPAHRAATWAVALVLLAFSVVAGFSVGTFFLPSALLLLVAAVISSFVQTPDRRAGV